ncbi:MAG: uracil permease [Epulopiscium sp. Nuni2H_MBin003]|nr:MAG: uracil permease [Epulopiscium sp. Nuni2H_MBin003]
MENTNKKQASVFELDGIPKFSQALPLALQHVVAMIVGCVTPAIIIAGVADLSSTDRIIFIQTALIIAALSTFLQLFPIARNTPLQLGSGLPVIIGVSFFYLSSMQSIVSDFGIAGILGAQFIGGIIAIIVGLMVSKIRKFFPPLITGTVVFTIGLSLYPTAVNYMAGGTASPTYGSLTNWFVAFFTLTVVTVLNHFGKGFVKLSSILIGIIAGYLVSIPFGLIDLSAVSNAGLIQLPIPMYFGMTFDISAIIAMGILFSINAIQAIGDYSATTTGGLDREPTNEELKGGIIGSGISNMVGGIFGGLPTATFSQNVGIVTTTKVVNRYVLGLAAVIILLAGLLPKFSALLITIPQPVLGGATISVFASIAMTGMRLITSAEMDYRNTSIVGLSVALGMGITQASASLATLPPWVMTIFGRSPVVIATISAVFLNIVLPHPKK